MNDLNVLLVEDDEITRFLVQAVLKQSGIQSIDSAENGSKAIERLTEHSPDLILLDLNMPVMDGFEFLEKQATWNGDREIKVAVLTSSDRQEDYQRAMAYDNVIGYLQKPLKLVDFDQLVESMQ